MGALAQHVHQRGELRGNVVHGAVVEKNGHALQNDVDQVDLRSRLIAGVEQNARREDEEKHVPRTKNVDDGGRSQHQHAAVVHHLLVEVDADPRLHRRRDEERTREERIRNCVRRAEGQKNRHDGELAHTTMKATSSHRNSMSTRRNGGTARVQMTTLCGRASPTPPG